MTTRVGEVKELKEGKFVVIDGEPCRIVSIQVAKTGKHGSAKARVEGMGLIDNQKRSFISPVEASCEIPILEKKTAQVLAFVGGKVQLMDMSAYTTFELPKPTPEEVEGNMVEGCEVELITVMGKNKILRVR